MHGVRSVPMKLMKVDRKYKTTEGKTSYEVGPCRAPCKTLGEKPVGREEGSPRENRFLVIPEKIPQMQFRKGSGVIPGQANQGPGRALQKISNGAIWFPKGLPDYYSGKTKVSLLGGVGGSRVFDLANSIDKES